MKKKKTELESIIFQFICSFEHFFKRKTDIVSINADKCYQFNVFLNS